LLFFEMQYCNDLFVDINVLSEEEIESFSSEEGIEEFESDDDDDDEITVVSIDGTQKNSLCKSENFAQITEMDDEYDEIFSGINEKTIVHDARLQKICDFLQKEHEKCASMAPLKALHELDVNVVKAFAALPDAQTLRILNPLPVFDSIRFFDVNPLDETDTHYYEVFNHALNCYERCLMSATKIVGSFFSQFDADASSKTMASQSRTTGPYAFKSAEEIKEIWAHSSMCGSALHRAAEYILNYGIDMPHSVMQSEVFRTRDVSQFVNFIRHEILGVYDIMRTELRLSDFETRTEHRENSSLAQWCKIAASTRGAGIFSHLPPPCKVAGSADAIVHRRGTPDDHVEILDWKRTPSVRSVPFGDSKRTALPPCNTQLDSVLEKYSNQLRLYAYMIHSSSTLKVTGLALVVIHPQNLKYTKIQIEPNFDVIFEIVRTRLRQNRELCKSVFMTFLRDRRRLPPSKTVLEARRYIHSIDEYFEKAVQTLAFGKNVQFSLKT
jgi:hypothetical protein